MSVRFYPTPLMANSAPVSRRGFFIRLTERQDFRARNKAKRRGLF